MKQKWISDCFLPNSDDILCLSKCFVSTVKTLFSLLPLSAPVWFYQYKHVLGASGLTWCVTMHFSTPSLAVAPPSLSLRFLRPAYTTLLPPRPPVLAESTVGSCARRPNTQASMCGRRGLQNPDFYSAFSALLCLSLSLNSYFFRVKVQLFPITVVEFQKL